MTERTGAGASRETEKEEARVRGRFHRRLIEEAGGFTPPQGKDRLRLFGTPTAYERAWGRVLVRGTLIGGIVAAGVALVVLAGYAASLDVAGSGVFESRLVSPLSAALMLLLAAAMLLLRPAPVPAWGRRTADLLGATACALAVLAITAQASGGDLAPILDWTALQGPSLTTLLLVLLLGIGVLSLDRDGPEHRLNGRLAAAVGIVLLAGLLSHGNRIYTLSREFSPDLSLLSLIGTGALALAFVTLRPKRGLAGFLASSGPGPAMARLLIPVVLAIPIAMTAGALLSRTSRNAGPDLVMWVVEQFVEISLVVIVVFASRRLQRYFEEWRDAAEGLSEQAEVLEAMAEGVAMIGLRDERVILANPQFDRMHGYEPGDLVGESIHVIRPEDSTPEEVRDWGRISQDLLERGTSQFETRARCRDGSLIWCRTNSMLTEHPRYGPVMIMVRSDITAEHEAMVASAAAEARFRQVFEQSPIGLALVRPDGGFDRVNPTFEELTGYPAAELYRMTFADITHPDDLAEDLRLTGAMFSGKTDGFQMQKRYVRKDGAVVRVDLSAVNLLEISGQRGVALAMVQDVTERYELGRRLQYLAEHDPLTGLFNRRRFERDLAEAAAGAGGGPGRGLAVMLVDIDNFKFINDSHGHSIGDRLIVRTGEILKGRLRGGDVLARQGGDEFVMLLKDIAPEDAPNIAGNLVREIAAGARVDGEGVFARATASIGVVTDSGSVRTEPEDLIRAADIAMYEAKDAGRNGFRVHSARTSAAMVRGIDWHGRIREALDRDLFTFYCQPLVSLKGGPAPGFELFLRLPGPDGRPISPNAFLPVAERNNLIGEIDHWVARKAIRLLAECGPAHPSRLFVNLSGQSVGDLDLVSTIGAELGRNGVDPGRLVFEITETTAIADIERARTFTTGLSRIGCGTALDDFGAGFSSFYYLKHIPTDFVKIDGEFIRNLADDSVSQLLVRSLAELGRNLGRQTVAEQVEDERALDLLTSYGVDLAQGFLPGRPRPATVQSLRYPASRDMLGVRTPD